MIHLYRAVHRLYTRSCTCSVMQPPSRPRARQLAPAMYSEYMYCTSRDGCTLTVVLSIRNVARAAAERQRRLVVDVGELSQLTALVGQGQGMTVAD